LAPGAAPTPNALGLHALIIALGFGLIFTIALRLGGERLYTVMGGSGGSLAAANTYSNVIFTGAVLVWLFNSLANVIRGTGNMAFPALVSGVTRERQHHRRFHCFSGCALRFRPH
jgi:Na+-driven multidrug efflux pump